MTDFHEMYAALAQEADSARLDTPDVPRRRADRRRRTRVTLAVAAAAVLVGGITAGGQVLLRADGSPLPPGVSGPPATRPASPTPPSSSPSLPSSSPSSAAPGTTGPGITVAAGPIPDRAFLQRADTNRADAPYQVSSDGALPALCGAKDASDALIKERRTFHVIYSKTPTSSDFSPDGTFDETITTYQSDGAERFMQQLRAAVTACPSQTRDGVTSTHRLLTPTKNGDEAILFEIRYPARDGEGKPTGSEHVKLVSAVRVGNVAMVLVENPWEGGRPADRGVVDQFTRAALTRLRSWLG
ncbi:hypothetical protein AB0H83_05535 [Dactylosporangium sp. NPDC050688]|uniref:hypothetical protein n=1 Tax=Dactylosporangium sp. NPDC050688 TaxID=3157217 RepID=UPI0033F7A3A7